MTDMTVALRVFADTQAAQTGLRTLAEGLRDMGVRAKVVAVDSAEAALRSTTAWTRSGAEITGTMTAIGAALEAGVPDLSGVLGQQAADLADTAMASASYAAALAEIRAMLNPLAAEADAVRDALVQVAAAEELGAISAQEAGVMTDRLTRSLTDMETRARAAGLPLRDLGPAGQQGATGIQQLIEAQTGITRATEEATAAQLRQGQMLDALKARFNPIFAVTQRYEQELRDIAEAERLGAISAGEAAAARDRATAAMAPAASGLQRVGASAGAASAYVANLGYQFNDIAMMLAAGQNPLMLAMQQGTQVSQVFQQMQASGLAIGTSLRSALMGMVSPLSLITLGTIAGGAALLQWATSGVAATISLEDAMSKLSEGVSSYESAAEAAARSTAELRKEFGDGAEAARALLAEIAALDRWQAAGALAASTRVLEDQYDLRVQGRISATELSGMFGLSLFGRGREGRQAQIGSVIEGFDAVQAAASLPDEDARIDAMAAATARLRDAFAAAADASGDRSDAERAILRTLTDQVLAATRLQEIRDRETRAHRDRLREMQQGEDRATRATRPEPLSGEAFQASFAERADLGRQAAMAALVARHGRDSLEVARAQVEEERRLYDLALQKEAISETEKRKRLEAWDLAKGLPALESQRRVEAERLLATLQQEAAMQRAIATYGEDSAEVARLRADQERAAFEATVATLVPAGDLRAELLAAWENARGLGAVDMASGIGAAAKQARDLADALGVSLQTASRLAALGPQGTVAERLDPSGQVYSGRGSVLPTAADIAWMGAGGIDPAMAKRIANLGKSGVSGKGGGGAGARDTLAGLSREAMELLAGLDIAAASVGEKVRVGLLSVAEGESQMANAKERAAGQLADLIARLDRLGPAGKAAADAARGALQDLATQAGKTGEDIRAGMIRSFEDDFIRSLTTGETAMTAFADHVQAELARAFTQKFVTPMITPLIDGVMGLFGGIFSADGNVIGPRGVIPFAEGGVPSLPGLGAYRDTIVTRPTAFPIGSDIGIMGEAGDEAILPVVTGAGGQGVRATAPDGSETVLPLQRAADGKLGVAVPGAAAAPADKLGSQAAAITRMLQPGPPVVPAGAEAILPLAAGPGGRGVRATGPDGASGLLPIGRGAGGALAVQLPDVGAIVRRPSFFADGAVIGRLSAPARVAEAAAAAGAGGGLRSAGVVIQNHNPSARVEARERETADGIAFDVVIEQLETALADRARRGVGTLAGVLGTSFGLGRVGR